MEQVDSVLEASNGLAKKWFTKSAGQPKVAAPDYAKDLKESVENLALQLSLPESEHPYQTPLIFSIGELIRKNCNKIKIEEAVQIIELGLTQIISMKWFPIWSEKNLETLNSQLTFTNPGALDLYRDSVAKSVEQNEIPLNAGATYMLDQGLTGDGMLIATNRRLIFAFDEDYKKRPLSFMLTDIINFSLAETSVVPMSKELTIHFQDRSSTNSVKFYVGDFYSVELTNLFKTFGY